jgi:hypothetical protein
MPFVILPTNSISGGYDVTNSLRFNSGSTDNLQRTFSSGNRKTYTLSFWIKKTAINQTNFIFQSLQDGNNFGQIYFNADQFGYESYIGSLQFQLITTQVFRDVSAWYHIVVAIDTTQATSSNRGKIYVNGSQVTSFAYSTYPSQNYDTFFNQNRTHTIGANTFSGFGNLLNGYLSDYFFIDGQALDPTSFGETDFDTGIWKPKAYTGTYGTNGFYLQFKNSASLGTDSSGNGNTFTVNNLTSIDQTTDTPTNNFCTLNPLISAGNDSGNKQVLSEGNLYVTGNQASWCHSRGTMSYSVGKWYWEAKITGKIADMNIGVSNTGTNMFGGTVQSLSGNTTIYPEGDKNINGTITTGVFTAYSLGDIIGIAHNADANTVTFYKNGSAILSDQSVSGGNDTSWTPASAVYNTTGFFSFNFGSPIYSANSYTDGAGYGNFSYAVPSGYYSLNTKNLATFG